MDERAPHVQGLNFRLRGPRSKLTCRHGYCRTPKTEHKNASNVVFYQICWCHFFFFNCQVFFINVSSLKVIFSLCIQLLRKLSIIRYVSTRIKLMQIVLECQRQQTDSLICSIKYKFAFAVVLGKKM